MSVASLKKTLISCATLYCVAATPVIAIASADNVASRLKANVPLREAESISALEEKIDLLRAQDKYNEALSLTFSLNAINPFAALRHGLLLFQACREKFGEVHPTTLCAMSAMKDSYAALGRYSEALNIAREALDLSRRGNGEKDESTLQAVSSLSEIFRQIQQHDKAKELDELAYNVSRELYGASSLQRAQYINNLAEDTILLKDELRARSLYEELSKLYGKNNVDIPIEQRINASFVTGQYQRTVELCKAMLEKLDDETPSFDTKTREISLKCILAKAYLQMDLCADALAVYANIVDSYEIWRDQDDLSTNGWQKERFFSIVDVYKECAFWAHKLNYTEMSFQITELCRMRNLVDQFSEESLSRGGLFQEEEIQKLAAYESQLAVSDERIKTAIAHGDRRELLNLQLEQITVMDKYNAYKRQLQKKYSQYKKMLVSRRHDALRFSKYRRVLPKGAYLIEFSLYPEKNLILVYLMDEENNLQIQQISIDGNFLAQCRLYHELLSYHNIEAMRSDGRYLWRLADGNAVISQSRQPPAKDAKIVSNTKEFRAVRQSVSEYLGVTLLSPISRNIASAKAWIIVPDGELNNIPFETLPFNGAVAINSFDISYVPSLAVLKLMQIRGEENAQKTRKELFAMGNAFYGNGASPRRSMAEVIEDMQNVALNRGAGVRGFNLTKIVWNALPGTKKEIEQVAALFPETATEVHQGREATESRLKSLNKNGGLANYKYLLFAAHGLFIPKVPELSSIVLSQGIDAGEDGYVTVEEWMSYNLASSLVYLSACESGLGEYQVGEGIIGIPYALCMAGNQNTVMSLWKVDDTQTAKFSSAFFEKLRKGGTPSKALNATKREFMANPSAKYSDPSIWSAFLLYGI